MAISDIIAKLLVMLKLKKSDVQKYEKMEHKLRLKKKHNIDRLDDMKERIATLEQRARVKKVEYEAATGNTKRIIIGEIERTFGDLDRLRGQETIIGQNLDKISLSLVKLDEWRVAKEQGVDEDMLDDLAIDLEDVFADLKATDRTSKSLESVRYESPQTKSIDVDSRLAELQGEAPSSEALSPSTAERLKELDEE